jgi:exosortase/archaeosortase family protein
MTAYGVLVCQVCFRSWPRRAAFMALALVVPVLANGVRAWGTIVLAGRLGIQFAAGFDHVFYGWVFFAVVMALTMLAGWPFFDRARDDPPVQVAPILADRRLAWAARWSMAQGVILAALAGLALGFVAWGAAAGRLAAPLPARIDLPTVPGWHRVGGPSGWPWQPRHAGPIIACLAAMPTGRGMSWTFRSRSMPGRARGARRAALAKAQCRRAAAGPGKSPPRASPVAAGR